MILNIDNMNFMINDNFDKLIDWFNERVESINNSNHHFSNGRCTITSTIQNMPSFVKSIIDITNDLKMICDNLDNHPYLLKYDTGIVLSFIDTDLITYKKSEQIKNYLVSGICCKSPETIDVELCEYIDHLMLFYSYFTNPKLIKEFTSTINLLKDKIKEKIEGVFTLKTLGKYATDIYVVCNYAANIIYLQMVKYTSILNSISDEDRELVTSLNDYCLQYGVTINNSIHGGIIHSDCRHIFFNNGWMGNITIYKETLDEKYKREDPFYDQIPEIDKIYLQAKYSVSLCDHNGNWNDEILNSKGGYKGKLWCYDFIDIKSALDEIRSLPAVESLAI